MEEVELQAMKMGERGREPQIDESLDVNKMFLKSIPKSAK